MARMCTIDDEVESVQTFDEFDPEMAQTCVRALTGAIPYQVLPVKQSWTMRSPAA